MSRVFVSEALRVYRRYQREIVEGFRICPWAEKAQADGHVEVTVCLEAAADVATTLAAVDAFGKDENVQIGLLLFPRLRVARADFERFVSAVREADAARGRGTERMALAAFHPDASPDTKEPGRLVPFLRRTPDPTIQCVRRSLLDAVREGDPMHGTQVVDPSKLDLAAFLSTPPAKSISDTIAAHNLDTVLREGVARVEAVLADIRRDRDESYAKLGDEL